MEIRVIGRSVLAGLIAGVLGFIFSYIFAEPVVQKAIDYESARDDVLSEMNKAAGLPIQPDGPEIFSRSIQSTFGIATGIIGMSIAFAALVAVAFLILHGRYQVRPQTLVWGIAAFGFTGLFLLPYVKYPANPPAIGHTFTIQARGALYLSLVVVSVILVIAGFMLTRRFKPRFGWGRAILLAAGIVFVVYCIVIGVLPSLGNLQSNIDMSTSLGYARAATETPQPILNILNQAISIDGVTYAPGQLVYPGFDADLLWKFRWYSLINQLLIWTTIALVFGALVEKFLKPKGADDRQVAEALKSTTMV